MRVTCVLRAGLIAWHILHGKGLAYAFCRFILARAAIKGLDFASVQNLGGFAVGLRRVEGSRSS